MLESRFGTWRFHAQVVDGRAIFFEVLILTLELITTHEPFALMKAKPVGMISQRHPYSETGGARSLPLPV